jgi:hypothetical protein
MKRFIAALFALVGASAIAQTTYKTTVSIAMPTITAKSMGVAPFEIVGTASNGASVALTSAAKTKCTVSGNTVTLLAAGECVLLARTALDATYSAGQTPIRFTIAATVTPPPPPPPPPVLNTTAYPFRVWDGKPVAVPASTTGKTYYVDGTLGSDANVGTVAAAFKTIGKAVSMLAAGDTILIRKGLYREPVDLSQSSASGTAAKPITVGSFGDGEVIVDGSPKVIGWTQVSGGIYKAPVNFAPVGIVVNDVPLRQVRQGQDGSTAPQDGLGGVIAGSGKWYVGGGFITADFGAVDPNLADVVVPKKSQGQQHVYYYEQSHITFKGLTIRGSGSNGIWGYGSNITVDSCDIKFNGKAAVSFIPFSGKENTDNKVVYTRAYHNVLNNWPRGNNFNAEAGGGWPGTVVWSGNLRPYARGNLVYMNGGEGIISYGAINGQETGSATFEENVAYDNWSVNMYFDNQPNNIARRNILYNHPLDNADYLYVGAYPYNNLGKYSTCLMLANEYGSGSSGTGYAALKNTTVENNIIAGCRIGIRDYAEGSPTQANHGLIDTRITNNTIILPAGPIPNTDIYGIYLQDNGSRNARSVIAKNIIYGTPTAAGPLMFTAGPVTGVTIDDNIYYTRAVKPFGQGYNTVIYYDFAGWLAKSGSDAGSEFIDPQFADVAAWLKPGKQPYDWRALASVAPGYGAKF